MYYDYIYLWEWLPRIIKVEMLLYYSFRYVIVIHNCSYSVIYLEQVLVKIKELLSNAIITQ